MRIIDPGHTYQIDELDKIGADQQILRFVKRMGKGYPGNENAYQGTTIQEVCRALIDRLQYVNGQGYDRRNLQCIENLREVIWLLEQRAAERHGVDLPSLKKEIEAMPTCSHCGHIVCKKVKE